jgi:hypothetical protein
MIVVYVKMFAGGPSSTADAGLIIPVPVTPSAVTSKTQITAPKSRSGRVALSEPVAQQLTRDPFAIVSCIPKRKTSGPAADSHIASDALELQSTICGDQPMAVINGQVLKVGDEIEGFLLERVEPTSVWVKRNNARRELKLRLWSEVMNGLGGGR